MPPPVDTLSVKAGFAFSILKIRQVPLKVRESAAIALLYHNVLIYEIDLC
jgi:hypothetical protein